MTQSMSIRGATGYAHDCTYALPKIAALIELVGRGETYDGEFENDMKELEAWFAKRGKENWEHPAYVANTPARTCRTCGELPDDGTCDKCGDTILTTLKNWKPKGAV